MQPAPRRATEDTDHRARVTQRSITQGILWGFLLHALLYTVVGRAKEVGLVLWILAVLSAGLLLIARSG